MRFFFQFFGNLFLSLYGAAFIISYMIVYRKRLKNESCPRKKENTLHSV